jgi:glucose/arabinose dehydrogenase/PKD repeat protein
VVSGRLSRLTASGSTSTGSEQVLIEDWCQQYPSHSVGGLEFGADGMLYVSGGDGASFNFADYGQDGSPLNPCGDPPGGAGSTLTPPTAEGGALRSQDLRTIFDPVGLNGAILRVDPATGAGLPNNPLGGSPDPNARRIIAHGLRNPFRITVRPGTNEVWVGDVGWNSREEINRIVAPTDGNADNFGWPCYEGPNRQSSYDSADLNICENLYGAGTGAVVMPLYNYSHSEKIVANEGCPTGSSSISGLAFYQGGSYPDHLRGLFFADYSRECIWFMRAGADGLPDPAQRSTFAFDDTGVVDLEIGPNGDLFAADFDGGRVLRYQYTGVNQPPTAVATANPSSGDAPLTVAFSATGSSDPEAGALTYAWDLDADGAYDDSTASQPSFTYTQAGTFDVGLRVTDPQGATGTDTVTVTVGSNTPPVPTITSPGADTRWKVGDVIEFAGTATDAEDGVLPPSALSWSVTIEHCPSNCHTHPFQTFPGVAGGSFPAPDHEYPSHLALALTATDSTGARRTVTQPLHPQTVDLRFETDPTGLTVDVGPSGEATPFTRTVIVGSSNSITAPSPQTGNGSTSTFLSWSDGGAQTHNIVAPATATTYTAHYQRAVSPPVAAYGFDEPTGTTMTDASGRGNNGTRSGATPTVAGRFGGALSFDGVDDRVTVPDSDSLDLTTGMTLEAWVRPAALGSVWRTTHFKVRTGGGGLVYGQYAHNRTSLVPISEALIAGGLRNVSGPPALPLNQWSHLATTYDGSTMRMYVNGTLAGSTLVSGAITTSTGELWIGGNPIWAEWFSGLIDEVRVYDRALSAAELQGDMNTRVGTPDGTAPTAPGALTATGSLGSAQLSWTGSTDDVAVDHYNVHRSTSAGFTPSTANRVAQPTGTSYTDSGLAAGTYYYAVTAEDAAGNVSQPSAERSAVVTADTTPPSVSVSAPAAGATVSGVLDLTATASDNAAVAGVQFKVDGTNVGTEDTSPPYSVSWDSRVVDNGDHSIVAVARDAAGNTRNSDPVAVRVDNSAPPPPPPNGVVAAYGFEDANGNQARDVAGTNHGTLAGGPGWSTAGRFGGAISFDGVDDSVVVPDAAGLDLSTGMTLEAWVRPSALGTTWRTALAKQHNDSLAYSLYANRNTTVPSTEIYVNGRLRGLNGTAALPLNQWSHLASTYDGSAIRLFVNGAQVATAARAGAIEASTGPLSIGGNAAHAEWFAGLIDEVRVYNRALSASEIQADMNTAVGGGTPDTAAPSVPGNLVATGGLGSAQLTWSASTDAASGVRRYNVHRSSTPGFAPTAANRIAQPAGTSYTDSGLSPGAVYYVVTAEDNAGNVSAPSSEARADVTSDTTPPSVSVTAPSAGATLSGIATLTATASDNDAVASVQFLVDGVAVGAADTTSPYSVQWDTRTTPNGDYDITARAVDRAGNPRESAAVPVTVDNTVAPPPPGLVAGYGFEETTGVSATDTSGNGNTGTVAGPARSAAGRFGRALSFDGIDDRVTVPDANSLDLTTGMTISAWARPSALGTRWRTALFKVRTGGGGLVYGLYANRNTGFPMAEALIGSLRNATGTAGLPLDQWSHIAATYDGAVLRLFVNGAQTAATTISGALTTSTGELWIGGNPVWAEWYAGLLDEVRVYQRALTASELQADMARSVVPGA